MEPLLQVSHLVVGYGATKVLIHRAIRQLEGMVSEPVGDVEGGAR